MVSKCKVYCDECCSDCEFLDKCRFTLLRKHGGNLHRCSKVCELIEALLEPDEKVIKCESTSYPYKTELTVQHKDGSIAHYVIYVDDEAMSMDAWDLARQVAKDLLACGTLNAQTDNRAERLYAEKLYNEVVVPALVHRKSRQDVLEALTERLMDELDETYFIGGDLIGEVNGRPVVLLDW